MTRNLIDLIFYAAVALSLPLAAFVLWLWSRKVWAGAKQANNYSRGRIYLLMIPGIVLMILTVVPMFYALGLQKADDHCLAMFSMPEPDYIKNLSAEDLKARRMKEMQRSCPRTDYDDLFSRIR